MLPCDRRDCPGKDQKIALACKSLKPRLTEFSAVWAYNPVYHKCDETIRGHVFCSFLALVPKCELESRLRRSGLEWEWAEVIRGLDNLHQVEATLQGRRFLLRSHLQGNASQALRAAGVAIPPTLRELS
jgi:hypothetical protein